MKLSTPGQAAGSLLTEVVDRAAGRRGAAPRTDPTSDASDGEGEARRDAAKTSWTRRRVGLRATDGRRRSCLRKPDRTPA
mmetsp:Transcript_8151/g.21147  ORF Transcript_8151/g.21147 Transcript_8151/m.21147 type:complete len:80 (-) Transcript_8151:814-1053(-)